MRNSRIVSTGIQLHSISVSIQVRSFEGPTAERWRVSSLQRSSLIIGLSSTPYSRPRDLASLSIRMFCNASHSRRSSSIQVTVLLGQMPGSKLSSDRGTLLAPPVTLPQNTVRDTKLVSRERRPAVVAAEQTSRWQDGTPPAFIPSSLEPHRPNRSHAETSKEQPQPRHRGISCTLLCRGCRRGPGFPVS